MQGFDCIVKDAITGHLGTQHLLLCLTNHLRALNKVTQLVDSGDDIDMRFLHFSKSFDIIHHLILRTKLSALGISTQIVGWVRSFLANHSFHVRIDDIVYGEAFYLIGVPKALQLVYYYS